MTARFRGWLKRHRQLRALRRQAYRFGLALAYVGAVVSANWLAQRYGLIPIGFGLTVVAGTFAAGMALLVRNIGQDELGRPATTALMLLGTGLSWWLASPALAVASAVAFGLSETADMTVYTWLRSRGRPKALLAAALVGSLVDTLVFLHLAGFPVTASTVLGQLIVKVGISALCSGGLVVQRRVARAST